MEAQGDVDADCPTLYPGAFPGVQVSGSAAHMHVTTRTDATACMINTYSLYKAGKKEFYFGLSI
jgi:hypothetical protein